MKKSIVTLLTGTCLLLAAAFSVACPGGPEPIVVRTLNLATTGESGMLIVTSEAEARRVWGDDVAKQCIKMVDFTKEKIVRISFETVGPPDDILRHEIVGNDVNFIIESPPIGIRGQRLGMIVHVFAVPIGAKVNLNRGSGQP